MSLKQAELETEIDFLVGEKERKIKRKKSKLKAMKKKCLGDLFCDGLNGWKLFLTQNNFRWEEIERPSKSENDFQQIQPESDETSFYLICLWVS